jgi:hypothetical protein
VRPLRLLSLIAALSAVSATSLLAQKFQEPTRDELQMTADPSAPGSSAVFLDISETTDNYSHYISAYARIKIFTEAGKQYATVEVPRSGGQAQPILEARTIHPDGSIVPLTGKAAELLQAKTINGRQNVTVFNLPDVTVGSILEYKWTVPMTGDGQVSGFTDDNEDFAVSAFASSIPHWQVQRPLFAHHQHFFFKPFSSLETASNTGGANSIYYMVNGEIAKTLLFSARLPAAAKVEVSQKGDYTLDIKDVPALVREANTPPLGSLAYHVDFYYSPYPTLDTYWDNEGKRWLKQFDHFAAVTDTLRDAATHLTAGADSDEAKARKLYDAVQALENTSFTREKSAAERQALHMKREDRSAQDIWTAKSGSSDELAALYLALAHAAGLDASPMYVADRRYLLFDPGLLSLAQLRGNLVVLKLNGKDVYTDPGEKFCPFGQLHWAHSLSGGLRQTPLGVTHDSFTPPIASKEAITAHSADITLDPVGNATGTVRFVFTGPDALRWRQLNALSDPSEVQKQFNESLHDLLPAGISGELDHFQSLDNAAVPLAALVKVHGSLGSVTGKRLIAPAFFFQTNPRTQFVATDQRQHPVDLHYGEQQIDEVIYHLPTGYTVESAPPAAQLPWPEHAALVVKVTPGPGTLTIKRIYARAFVFLDAKEYPALRDYAQKIATSDAQSVVFTQPAS